MKICIVSDSHDRADALAQAVREAKARGAEAVIHCGDLIGAQTVKLALAQGLPLHLIHGNNLGDPQVLHLQTHKSGGLLRYHGADARLELGGRRVFVVHHHDYGYAMACTGDWEPVCCGHSHQAEARKVASVRGANTWLVDPGTVAGLAAPRLQPGRWAISRRCASRCANSSLSDCAGEARPAPCRSAGGRRFPAAELTPQGEFLRRGIRASRRGSIRGRIGESQPSTEYEYLDVSYPLAPVTPAR